LRSNNAASRRSGARAARLLVQFVVAIGLLQLIREMGLREQS